MRKRHLKESLVLDVRKRLGDGVGEGENIVGNKRWQEGEERWCVCGEEEEGGSESVNKSGRNHSHRWLFVPHTLGQIIIIMIAL